MRFSLLRGDIQKSYPRMPGENGALVVLTFERWILFNGQPRNAAHFRGPVLQTEANRTTMVEVPSLSSVVFCSAAKSE